MESYTELAILNITRTRSLYSHCITGAQNKNYKFPGHNIYYIPGLSKLRKENVLTGDRTLFRALNHIDGLRPTG